MVKPQLTVFLLLRNAPIYQGCLVVVEVDAVVQEEEDPEEADMAVVEDTIEVDMIGGEDMTEEEEDMVAEVEVDIVAVVVVTEAEEVVAMHRTSLPVLFRCLYDLLTKLQILIV